MASMQTFITASLKKAHKNIKPRAKGRWHLHWVCFSKKNVEYARSKEVDSSIDVDYNINQGKRTFYLFFLHKKRKRQRKGYMSG